MRQLVHLFGSSILCLLIMTSCKKNLTPGNQGSQVSGDTLLLKKFIVLNTLTSPNDTLEIYNYVYDNLNRCTQVTKINGNSTSTNTSTTEFYYSGSDLKISSLFSHAPVVLNILKQYFTYNPQGVMLYDSAVYYMNTTAIGSSTFYYGPGYTTYKLNNDPPGLKTIHSIQRDGDGKIISARDSLFTFNSPVGTYNYTLRYDYAITYDNKFCPFYKIYPKRPVEDNKVDLMSGTVPPFFAAMAQQNNILTESRINSRPTSGYPDYSNTYQYTYNSQNFPTTVTYFNTLNTAIRKGIYVY